MTTIIQDLLMKQMLSIQKNYLIFINKDLPFLSKRMNI